MKRLTIFLLALATAFSAFGSGTALASAEAPTRYVSIGDSIAAGAGLPFTDDRPETVACGRSNSAYPTFVAEKLELPLEHYACGDATVPQGISGPQSIGGMQLTPQIERLFKDSSVPSHVSLTVGSNDIQWSTFIRKCYAAECGSWQDTMTVAKLQYNLFNNLRHAMDDIKNRSGDNQPPKVVLTGYFQPVSTNQPACFDTQGLTEKEIGWIRAQDHILNGVLQSVAYLYDFVNYAPVDFTGHELCSSDPWLQGLRDKASYHPTAAGQRTIAEAVMRAW